MGTITIFHLWECAVDHQTQQFMNLRAGMLGLWGGSHCCNVYREEWRRRIWDSADRHLFPSIWYVFSRVQGANNISFYIMSSSSLSFLIINAILDGWQWLLMFFSIYSCSIIPCNCSPPLPPRPWRSARTQGWPNPSGCPTSTTSSWRRSWTSRGSSTSPSAIRWAARLLSLLFFRTSFLHWSLMSVCPSLLFIWPLWRGDSTELSLCLDCVNRIYNSIFDQLWVEKMGMASCSIVVGTEGRQQRWNSSRT